MSDEYTTFVGKTGIKEIDDITGLMKTLHNKLKPLIPKIDTTIIEVRALIDLSIDRSTPIYCYEDEDEHDTAVYLYCIDHGILLDFDFDFGCNAIAYDIQYLMYNIPTEIMKYGELIRDKIHPVMKRLHKELNKLSSKIIGDLAEFIVGTCIFLYEGAYVSIVIDSHAGGERSTYVSFDVYSDSIKLGSSFTSYIIVKDGDEIYVNKRLYDPSKRDFYIEYLNNVKTILKIVIKYADDIYSIIDEFIKILNTMTRVLSYTTI